MQLLRDNLTLWTSDMQSMRLQQKEREKGGEGVGDVALLCLGLLCCVPLAVVVVAGCPSPSLYSF